MPGSDLRATPGKLAAFLGLVGFVSALNYIGNYAGSSSKESTDTALFHYSTAIGGDRRLRVILVIVVWIAAGRVCLPWEGIRNPLLALRAPQSWLRALGLAAATLLVAGLVISVIDSFLHGGREQGVVPKHFMHGHAAEYAANWVVIAGVAPFVEETTYRGLGFSLFYVPVRALVRDLRDRDRVRDEPRAAARRCRSSRSSASRSRGCAHESTACSRGCSSTARSTASRWRASSGTSRLAAAGRLVLLVLQVGLDLGLGLGEVLGRDAVEEALELVDDVLLADVLALELDRRLLDHLVGRVDRDLCPDGHGDRVGRARVDLELRAVVLHGDRGVERVLAQLGDGDPDAPRPRAR